MPQGTSEDCYCDRGITRVSQGDILRELDITINSKISGYADFSLAPSFSYGVVLSQECDVEQHFKLIEENKSKPEVEQEHDQLVETLLFCPAFPLESFLLGQHLGEQIKMSNFDGPKGQEKARKKIKNNDQYNRFHYLPALKDNFSELVVDFKRFYTIPIEIFDGNFKKFYITSIKDLFRERLSQRFTNYLARIGLPE